MNFDWFKGINKIEDLKQNVYNQTWFHLESWWNEHDSGIRQWTSFNLSGFFQTNPITITSAKTLGDSNSVIFVDTTSANITVTLPSAVGISGRQYRLMNIGTKILKIVTSLSQTINGGTALNIPGQYFSTLLISDGSNWFAF